MVTESVRVVEKLTDKKVTCYKEDLLHMEEMRAIFRTVSFSSVSRYQFAFGVAVWRGGGLHCVGGLC